MLLVEQKTCMRGEIQARHGCNVVETLPLRLTRQKQISFLKRLRCSLGCIYYFSISNRMVGGAQSRWGAKVRGWRVCRGRGIGGGREGGRKRRAGGLLEDR